MDNEKYFDKNSTSANTMLKSTLSTLGCLFGFMNHELVKKLIEWFNVISSFLTKKEIILELFEKNEGTPMRGKGDLARFCCC
jgi:hypothetical protein